MRNIFRLEHIESRLQVADILTKPLGGQQLERLIEEGEVFNNLSNMKEEKTTSPIGLLALLVMCIIFVDKPAEAFFNPAPAVNLLATEITNSVGIVKVELNYQPISPCTLDQEQAQQTARNVKQELYNSLKFKCESHYRKHVTKAYEDFYLCMTPQTRHTLDTNDVKKRNKRFIEPISTSILVGTAVVYIVSGVSTYCYTQLAPGSSYNRLNALEPRVDRIESALCNGQFYKHPNNINIKMMSKVDYLKMYKDSQLEARVLMIVRL